MKPPNNYNWIETTYLNAYFILLAKNERKPSLQLAIHIKP